MWFERSPSSPLGLLQDGDQLAATSGGLTDAQRAELIWRRLARFSVVYGVGWIFALAYYNLIATSFQFHWPRSTFLYSPGNRYADLLATWVQANAPNPYINPGTAAVSTYFPFPYAILSTSGELEPPAVVLTYLGITFSAVLIVWMWWLRKQRALWTNDSRWPVVVILSLFIAACNYPLLFAVDRGNLDPLAMCLMYGAIELAGRGSSIGSGILLALASASKGFPFAAILYWVRRKRVLGLAIAVAGFVASVLIPAAAFEGGLSVTLRGLLKNLGVFRQAYVVGGMSSQFSTDWLNAIRILARWFGAQPDMATIVPWYEGAVTVWAGLLGLLALCVVRETWRELLAIVLIMLAFPNVANDYKLVFLLPPLLEWLTSTTNGWRSAIFGVAAALLLLPKHFYFPVETDVASISCIINPMLLLALSAVLWPTPTETSRLRDFAKSVQMRIRALRFGASRRSVAHLP